MNMLKQVRFVIVASILLGVVCSVNALYEISDKGAWPKNWSKELEPLRNQSRSLFHTQYCIYEIPFTSRAEFEAAWPHILAVKSKKAPLTLLRSPDEHMGKTIKAGVRILSPLTGTLVTPQGTTLYRSPETESAIPDGNFIRIGPPWPDHIKSESGVLPESVMNENGKWVAYTEKKAKEFEKMQEEEKKRKGRVDDLILPYYFRQRARIEIHLVVDGDIVDLNRIPLPPDTPIIDKRFKDNKVE